MMGKLVRNWYALHTRSRFENRVYEGLLGKSVEVFLPKIRVLSKRRDRRKMIEVPLFSGYLFVESDLRPDEHLRILKTPGAVRLIGNTRGPLPVPREDIDSLRIMVSAEGNIGTGTRLEEGDWVMVTGGPFAGIRGIFVRQGTEGRVVVNIEALGRFAAVEVDRDHVEAIPSRTPS